MISICAHQSLISSFIWAACKGKAVMNAIRWAPYHISHCLFLYMFCGVLLHLLLVIHLCTRPKCPCIAAKFNVSIIFSQVLVVVRALRCNFDVSSLEGMFAVFFFFFRKVNVRKIQSNNNMLQKFIYYELYKALPLSDNHRIKTLFGSHLNLRMWFDCIRKNIRVANE